MIKMGAVEVKNGIYSVGILNPAMRIFDVIMRTEYGTTYNSYVVKGSEKTALIEVSHAEFFDSYLSNIKEVCDPAEIDYIVLNHCEPDHSGALADLMKYCPNAKIVVSKAGSIYLKNITNRTDLDVISPKDGESIDLGGKTLKFISAPLLHWPDSMFTYVEEDKTIFTCDFFGAHYCEPYVFDKNIVYEKAYEEAIHYYYVAIFGPFKAAVQKGLEKALALDFDTACVSHGPVLTKGNKLEYVIEKYKEWSAPTESDNKNIPVFYCSAYGNTGKIAEAIAAGISEVIPEANVEVLNINDYDMGELSAKLNGSDAFAIGTPTINSDAVAPVWNLLSHVDAINNRKKPAFVFGSFGWSGEGVPNVIARLNGLKMNVFGDGLKVTFVPSEADLENAKAQGAEFAKTFA